jgi:hypothetical protein
MEEILKQINKSWPKDVIIRALYTNLAPFFQRDLTYFLADEQTQYQMYLDDFKDIKGYGVCKKIADFYMELFACYDIDAKVIIANSNSNHLVPHYALIVRGDHNWYFIDPLKDLMCNQAHLRSNFYATRHPKKCHHVLENYPFIASLSHDYIKEIDEATGFIHDGVYYNDFMDILFDNLLINNKAISYLKEANVPFDLSSSSEIVKSKIWILSEYIMNSVNIPGKYERTQFYSYIMNFLFNHSERKRVDVHLNDPDNLILTFADDKEVLKYKEVDENGTKRFILVK